MNAHCLLASRTSLFTRVAWMTGPLFPQPSSSTPRLPRDTLLCTSVAIPSHTSGFPSPLSCPLARSLLSRSPFSCWQGVELDLHRNVGCALSDPVHYLYFFHILTNLIALTGAPLPSITVIGEILQLSSTSPVDSFRRHSTTNTHRVDDLRRLRPTPDKEWSQRLRIRTSTRRDSQALFRLLESHKSVEQRDKLLYECSAVLTPVSVETCHDGSVCIHHQNNSQNPKK